MSGDGASSVRRGAAAHAGSQAIIELAQRWANEGIDENEILTDMMVGAALAAGRAIGLAASNLDDPDKVLEDGAGLDRVMFKEAGRACKVIREAESTDSGTPE